MSLEATPTTRRLAFAAGVALAVVVAIGVVYAGSSERLAGGVRIDGLAVGGLSVGEARDRLTERGLGVERVPVRFVAGSASRTVSASQLGVRVDWQAAVDEARAVGDGFRPLRGWRRLWLRVSGADVQPQASSYESVVAFVVAELARKVDRRPVEPMVRRVGLSATVVDGIAGARVDQPAARAVVVASLATLDRGAPVALPVVTDQPNLESDDLAAAAEHARVALSAPILLTAGPSRYRIARWELARILRLPAGGATELSVAGAPAEKWLVDLRARVDRPARDATFRVKPGGIEIMPAAPGRELDVATTIERVLAASATVDKRVVSLPLQTSAPKRSTADAEAMGITGVVGSYTTTYGGTPGRLANVALVSRLIDGALVAPGATFSFNATTGERTAEQGFQEAPVIINGELQNGIGGGVCQVSTTVFNAAFEAGLPIGARTNHALYISHYPLGRDATVNFPDTDLRFTNDTGRWLLLRTFVGAGSLTVNLYGAPQDRRVETETGPLEVTGKPPI